MWISGICDFLEIWLPRKCFFKENVTSWEVRLPRKCEFLLKYDFPANLTFTGAAEKHGWQGFVNIGLRTFPKIRLPRKCDFPGSVTSWELWLPRKNEFNLTLRILIMFATPPQVQYMVSIFFLTSSTICFDLFGWGLVFPCHTASQEGVNHWKCHHEPLSCHIYNCQISVYQCLQTSALWRC